MRKNEIGLSTPFNTFQPPSCIKHPRVTAKQLEIMVVLKNFMKPYGTK